MRRTMVDIEVVKKALLLACRAPSVHNSQPWWWVADGAVLRLFLDPRRRLSGTDPSSRDALISCGAVLDHLRVAMEAAGWQANIDRFPNPNNPNHLASVEFRPLGLVTDVQRNRAWAILQRRTDRLPLRRPTYWAGLEPVLRRSIDDSTTLLDVLTDEIRPLLAEASLRTEALRRNDITYRSELQWWTSPFVLYEGVPPDALASVSELYRVGVARDFPARNHVDRRPDVAVDRSKIVVLSTPEDTRAAALGCGEALSTMLLECTMAGMATCTLTHLIELPDSRDIVRTFIGERGEPQVLVRVGVAPAMEDRPAATPRRLLDEVLQIH